MQRPEPNAQRSRTRRGGALQRRADGVGWNVESERGWPRCACDARRRRPCRNPLVVGARRAPEEAIPVADDLDTQSNQFSNAQDAAQALSKAGYPVPNAKTEAGRALIKQRIKAFEKLSAC